MDDLEKLKIQAGITTTPNRDSNSSITGSEKAKLMREHGIKPGTDDWFRLWFAKSHITGESPIKR
jgi:hypothetical protein